ncbi:uncharacterized protein K460DRAFT_377926 [Cucurbitaria berberidis CBS 394.84]|uniref:Pyridoxamine 5'-phosphate oxidase Alr4036 family FMN-binding domain-containing protein n=1 Tax=Cucurbitaria berberidis CBS 394.84 TaxID=1168544 RepID=A0A9P4L9V7_9PLEO|nr:uncharacterized protein K460DRAFT_377926 [Cucurbitaria berberidis CBS 394.84]KAF1846788.1 hypothetical protein K460DRAFT_377926 [Cucurbitaria berberidis CBS 394.84]
MASTAPATSNPSPAPWKSLFNEHISKMKSPEFVLGTLDSAPEGSPTPFVPRVRYCIFRGFWAELPENKHNDAERNPRVYESDCPTFTTDVRMEKVGQIFASAGHAEKNDQTQGSGGGGPVEAVYWITETGTQWRIKGRAYVIADDIEGTESSGVRTVKSEVGKRMKFLAEPEKERNWSWQKELTGFFGNQSPGIKGSFKNPPPGQSTTKPYDKNNLELGSKTDDLHDLVARQNFRLVVIVPDSVEQTDLSDPAKSRRLRYTFDESTQANAGWRTEELWP